MTAEACLRELPFVDVICCGESEKNILPLMRALTQGGDLSKVAGIAFRGNAGIIKTPCPPHLKDEELGEYTVFDHGPGWTRTGNVALEGGRGCPYECTFCSTSIFWGRHFRIKPVETLVAEMDKFHELYGTDNFAIQHDIFTANCAHLLAFCRALIAKGSPYKWRCSSRIDVLDAETIALMAQAGCIQMYLGIETGSPRMQRILKKNLDLHAASQRIRELIGAGIFSTSSFIYGFPEETEDDFTQTLSLMEQLYLTGNRNIQLHRFFPLPATEEAAKVYDNVCFDETGVDLSIFNRRAINDEGRELIRRHKDLFLQFYTFPSDLRSKYPWIEAVPMFLSTISEGFYETGKCLVRLYGIARLYFRHEALFREMYLRFSDIIFEDTLNETFMEYLVRLIEEDDGSPEVAEIFRYERDLLRYAASAKSEPETQVYAIDITLMTREGIGKKEETTVMFLREKGSGNLRAVKVPPEITIL
jgi:hypothetical protein